MMSSKTFLIVLIVFCVYVFIGSMVFHSIEKAEEKRRIGIEVEKRKLVRDAVNHLNLDQNEKNEYMDIIEGYCGKTLKHIPMDIEEKWDFYHSIFFVLTVVSTIGYGNLAPTTMLSRVFMIFYSVVGIPINGFIMIALGDFFGKSFTKLYNRWKDTKRLRQVDPSRLGLVAQIILYLVPGFTFFIFVPSILISEFENWTYDEAVYYSFVTLTTIGFGDYVAGNRQGDSNYLYYKMYQIFLLVWVIGGLGYVVMILNFIARGMRSKKLQQLEHRIASNIMKTPTKIRQELRTILEEFLMVRVKKVYKEFDYEPHRIERSQSCPDLMIYNPPSFPNLDRKRAFSECQNSFILQRIQSDTDLDRIDKELTFRGKNEQADLIIKVFDALSINEHVDEPGCYEGFSDRDILASEQYNSQWSLASHQMAKPKPAFRSRALSDVRYPSHILRNDNDHTWYGQTYLANYAKLMKDEKSNSEPMNDFPKEPASLFKRIKNNLLSKSDRNNDAERGNEPFRNYQIYPDNKTKRISTLSSNRQEQILEKTSVADLIRALSTLSDPPSSSSQQEDHYPDILSKSRTRRMPIRSNFQNRRTSLVTNPTVASSYMFGRRSSLVASTEFPKLSATSSGSYSTRRSSLAPVSELPPPYTQVDRESSQGPLNPSKIRRFSVRPVGSLSTPPQKFSKRDTEGSS